MGSLRERLAANFNIVKLTGPRKLSPEEQAFQEAFAEISASPLPPVRSLPHPGAGQSAAPKSKVYPPPRQVKLATRVLAKLIEKQDSIICDPEDLAKRAWAITDAMVAEYEARGK